MANEKHLIVLKKGKKHWNNWRIQNSKVISDLSGANLSKFDLCWFNLSNADLSGANLSNAKLCSANFSNADLSSALLYRSNLCGANLYGAKLSHADLRWANLYKASLYNANLYNACIYEADLREADLREADLRDADLSWTKLSRIDLSRSNLMGANLIAAQAIYANFEYATLTGVCLQDWHINTATRLTKVICDYVYLKYPQRKRYPYSGNFAPGEFTKLFQEALETVDLIFSNGIDWKAFLTSFEKLQVECGSDELSIQAIENKNDGIFVIRVNVPPDANKVEIDKYIRREYELELKALEERYRYELHATNKELAIYRQQSIDLMETVKILASRPITVEAKAVASSGDTYNQSGQIGIGHMSGGTIASGAKVAGVLNEAQQQNLAEAAKDIQRLLKQLEETNPSATEPEQIAYVNLATKPDLKQRAIGALKEGGEVAIEEFFLENKYLKVGKAIIKGWLQGSP